MWVSQVMPKKNLVCLNRSNKPIQSSLAAVATLAFVCFSTETPSVCNSELLKSKFKTCGERTKLRDYEFPKQNGYGSSWRIFCPCNCDPQCQVKTILPRACRKDTKMWGTAIAGAWEEISITNRGKTATATSIEKSLGNAGNALKKRIIKRNTHTRDKCKETKMVQDSPSGGSATRPFKQMRRQEIRRCKRACLSGSTKKVSFS